MLAPLPDKFSLTPRKNETLSIVAREVNASFFCDSINCRERIGSRLAQKGRSSRRKMFTVTGPTPGG